MTNKRSFTDMTSMTPSQTADKLLKSLSLIIEERNLDLKQYIFQDKNKPLPYYYENYLETINEILNDCSHSKLMDIDKNIKNKVSQLEKDNKEKIMSLNLWKDETNSNETLFDIKVMDMLKSKRDDGFIKGLFSSQSSSISVSSIINVIEGLADTPQEQFKNAPALLDLSSKFSNLINLIDTKLFIQRKDVSICLFLVRYIKEEYTNKMEVNQLKNSDVFSVISGF